MENRRRTYFIQKEFQTKFIVKFCLLIIAACLSLSLLVYLFSRQTVTTAFENSRLVIKSTADFMLPTLLASTAVSIILISISTIIVTLFISHRIAGPMFRFQKTARAIAEGNLDLSVNLRKKDQLQPMAAALEEMLGSLKQRVSSLKQKVNSLDAELRNLSGPQKSGLEERIKNLRQELDFFRV